MKTLWAVCLVALGLTGCAAIAPASPSTAAQVPVECTKLDSREQNACLTQRAATPTRTNEPPSPVLAQTVTSASPSPNVTATPGPAAAPVNTATPINPSQSAQADIFEGTLHVFLDALLIVASGVLL